MFDRFVVVDWSAQSTPKHGADSIWIGIGDAAGLRSCNPRTRTDAARVLDDLVDDAIDGRTLIGVDFSLGFPAGTAAALGLPADAAWSSMWNLLDGLIVDEPTNRNNRFEVAALLNERMTGLAAPFWGCPPAARTAHLGSTKPTTRGSVQEWRHVESVLRSRGRRPFSAWQLLGAGAVGSQSLLGVPRLARLVRRLGDRVDVWPFTTGLVAPSTRPGSVVIVEVWPSLLPMPPGDGRVRDAVQVETTASWLVECARDGSLASMFRPAVAADRVPAVVNEEGWVLGA